jgi:hypothetical protein
MARLALSPIAKALSSSQVEAKVSLLSIPRDNTSASASSVSGRNGGVSPSVGKPIHNDDGSWCRTASRVCRPMGGGAICRISAISTRRHATTAKQHRRQWSDMGYATRVRRRLKMQHCGVTLARSKRQRSFQWRGHRSHSAHHTLSPSYRAPLRPFSAARQCITHRAIRRCYYKFVACCDASELPKSSPNRPRSALGLG